MGKQKINTLFKKGTHFTWEERIILEYNYRKNRITSPPILGSIIGKCTRTIQREIHRGWVEHCDSQLKNYWTYNAELSELKAEQNNSAKGPLLKLGTDYILCNKISSLIIKKKYSPDAIILKFKTNGWPTKTRICTKTLYRYIEEGLIPEVTKENPWLKGTQRKKGLKSKRRYSRAKSASKSISLRPPEINKKNNLGHWEMDCVVIGRNKGLVTLLVLTERKSKFQIIRKMSNKTTNNVNIELNKIEKSFGSKKFRQIFKTITNDNGSEFMDYEGAEKSCLVKYKRTTIYYAHPYCSGERGSNENANKIIGRFIKKGESIGKYSKNQITEIETWMNDYPRRILNGLTANQSIRMLFN